MIDRIRCFAPRFPGQVFSAGALVLGAPLAVPCKADDGTLGSPASTWASSRMAP